MSKAGNKQTGSSTSTKYLGMPEKSGFRGLGQRQSYKFCSI